MDFIKYSLKVWLLGCGVALNLVIIYMFAIAI